MMDGFVIEKAGPDDLEAVVELYGDVCDALAASPIPYLPWGRGAYPTRETAEDWLQQDALYVLRAGERLAATLALTHQSAPGYASGRWQVAVPDEEVFLLHTIATHPDFQRKGLSSRMLAFAEEEGRRQGMKALQLDVCETNTPAISVYEKAGFHCVGKVNLHGLVPPHHIYRLYELPL